MGRDELAGCRERNLEVELLAVSEDREGDDVPDKALGDEVGEHDTLAGAEGHGAVAADGIAVKLHEDVVRVEDAVGAARRGDVHDEDALVVGLQECR